MKFKRVSDESLKRGQATCAAGKNIADKIVVLSTITAVVALFVGQGFESGEKKFEKTRIKRKFNR